MTYELSSSDRYGKFWHWFRMPLTKVESIIDMLIDREYVKPARSLIRCAEFCERTELFVMSALYILGNGAHFRSLYALTNISMSDNHKFFFVFHDAFNDMHDEYIYLPQNMPDMQRLSRYYESEGLPGAFGSMDVVHVKWSNCPAGDFNRAKGKEGYPTLAFQCIMDFNRRILGVFGHSLAQKMIRILSRRIRM